MTLSRLLVPLAVGAVTCAFSVSIGFLGMVSGYVSTSEPVGGEMSRDSPPGYSREDLDRADAEMSKRVKAERARQAEMSLDAAYRDGRERSRAWYWSWLPWPVAALALRKRGFGERSAALAPLFLSALLGLLLVPEVLVSTAAFVAVVVGLLAIGGAASPPAGE